MGFWSPEGDDLGWTIQYLRVPERPTHVKHLRGRPGFDCTIEFRLEDLGPPHDWAIDVSIDGLVGGSDTHEARVFYAEDLEGSYLAR